MTLFTKALLSVLGYAFAPLSLATDIIHNTPSDESLSKLTDSIETISITAERHPLFIHEHTGASTIINNESIINSGASNLSELLRNVAGVTISQAGAYGSLSELRFRGSESNHIMVLIDGIEVNDIGQGGLVDLSHILLSNVVRIEVLKGPQSALLGSNAMSGIINIITHDNHKAADITIGYGNQNTRQFSGRINNIGSGTSPLQFSLNAQYIDTDGENSSRNGNEKDGYKNHNVAGKLSYIRDQNNKVSLTARFMNYRNDFDANDYNTGLLRDANNHSKGQQQTFGLQWRYSPYYGAYQNNQKYNSTKGYENTSNGKAVAAWSQFIQLHFTKNDTSNFADNIFSNSTKGEKLRLFWNHNIALFDFFSLNIGAEGIKESFEQRGLISFADPNQNQEQSSRSLVLSSLYQLSSSFSVDANYRFDNNSEFKDATSHQVTINYQINEHWRLFLSTGKAIKNPTFTERFGFFPESFIGNAALKPEHQKSKEMGIKANFERFSMSTNVFSSSLKDEIQGFVFDENSGLFTAQNSEGESTRNGLEIELNTSLSKLELRAQYTYLNAKEQEALELRRPKHTGSITLDYPINDSQHLYFQFDYVGTRFDRFFPPFPEPSQTVALSSYWLTAVNYRWQVSDNTNVKFRVDNAFNSKYEDVFGYSGQSLRYTLSLQTTW